MLVDVIPIKEAVEKANKEGMSYGQMCRELEWYTNTSNGIRLDVTRLKRSIGAKPQIKRGKKTIAKQIGYDRAMKIIRAIGYDPVDWGL